MVAHLGFLADETVGLMGIEEIDRTFEMVASNKEAISAESLPV